MHLKNIEIINLWDKKPIKVTFENKVTFLTGINGSGKSSILNILFDTLMAHKNGLPTSKNRFWSCEAEFENNLTYSTALLPLPPKNDNNKLKIDDLINNPNKKIHDSSTLREIESLYTDDNKNTLRSVHYSDDLEGDSRATSLSYPDETYSSREEALAAIPNAFIYQEDRNSLHNVEKIANIKSSASFIVYKNSIDERFAYIREAFAIYESRFRLTLEDELLNAKTDGEKFEISNNPKLKLAFKQIEAKNNVIAKLNDYLKDSGKKVSRDKDNKITLEIISSESVIMWSLLSRGEKTLIYLFLVSLIYNGSLFLLDEPEISLHISWQKNLIADLKEIADKSQFIVATHSPSIISNGWLSNCLNIKV